MKREYLKPAIRIVPLRPIVPLCASGSSGDDDEKTNWDTSGEIDKGSGDEGGMHSRELILDWSGL